MELTRDELRLAAKMLDIAADKFSNHGCNDLEKHVVDCVEDGETLCTAIRKWNGDPHEEWPAEVDDIGDSSLMGYLSDRIKKLLAQ